MTTETTKSENPLRLGGEPGPRPSCLAEVRRRQVRGRSGIFQRGRVHGFPTREPFLVHFWSIFRGFFGKPLDYQPLPQQTGPPRQARQRLLGLSSINSKGEESNLSPLWHSHFRSSVTNKPN